MIKCWLLLLISPVFSKLMFLTNDDDYVNEFENNLTYEDFSDSSEDDYDTDEESPSLWVLKMETDLDSVKLRRGNYKEDIMFDEYMGPYMTRFKSRTKPNVTNAETSQGSMTSDEINNLKKELLEAINKFVLSIKEEPTIFLSDTDEYTTTPSLALYFKGIHTSMMVNSGEKMWQYVLSPRTQLPDWFYMEHPDLQQNKDGFYVDIPEKVKLDLFESLLRLLKLFFSHPV